MALVFAIACRKESPLAVVRTPVEPAAAAAAVEPTVAALSPAWRCEVSAPVQAASADSWLDVVTRIRDAQPREGSPVAEPPMVVTDDQGAQRLVCEQVCPAGGVVSTFVDDVGSTRQAHVVIPREHGFWVVPRIAVGQGTFARCPDEIVDTSIASKGALTVARFTLLTNYWEECYGDEDKPCFDGCYWASRTDYVVALARDTGKHVVLTGERSIAEPGVASPWQRLESEPVIEAIAIDDRSVTVHSCDPIAL